MTIKITYHIWVTVIATSSTADEAADMANAYQAVAMQVALCDTNLGGTVSEVGVPQVREADSWADSDGKRHSGYLLDFEVSTYVNPSKDVSAILKELK